MTSLDQTLAAVANALDGDCPDLPALLEQIDSLDAEGLTKVDGMTHQGDDRESALAISRQCMDSRTRLLGREHPDTLLSMYKTGCCLTQLGKDDEAFVVLMNSL